MMTSQSRNIQIWHNFVYGSCYAIIQGPRGRVEYLWAIIKIKNYFSQSEIFFLLCSGQGLWIGIYTIVWMHVRVWCFPCKKVSSVVFKVQLELSNICSLIVSLRDLFGTLCILLLKFNYIRHVRQGVRWILISRVVVCTCCNAHRGM